MTEKILLGKAAIITGANQGLGKEISRNFLIAGANDMLCARSYGLLEETEQELNPLLCDNQQMFIIKCEVSHQGEVNRPPDDRHRFEGATLYGPKGDRPSDDTGNEAGYAPPPIQR